VRLGQALTLADLEAVARGGRHAVLDDAAAERVDASRAAVERIALAGDEAPLVYGVNTGFGALAERRIGVDAIRKLQQNLVRSHATGIGPPLGDDAVRAMIVLRAQTLALGYSGVRRALIELLLGLLEADVLPQIPEQGSVGASGDLAPLAHLALVLIGEGEARLRGELLPGAEALRRAGLEPIALHSKEGLALVNGTQLMLAVGGLALADAGRLLSTADIAGAMSLEALQGSQRPFEERLMRLRPHPGQLVVASNLRRLLAASEIMVSHSHCGKVQDPYSLRCMPQVHGASRDALAWAVEVCEREMNSVTDNPAVFVNDAGEAEVTSGGNFHGQPVAFALDLAAIALAELANVSERRVEQLVNPTLSSGLTPFLARDSGLNSGFMIAQVASASLVSENKVLCHPASVDSIPSSAGREDHVSMGSISAHKLARIVSNVRACLAIELLTAAAGLDQRLPLVPGAGAAAAHRAIRKLVPPLDDDRPLHTDIARVAHLVQSGELEASVSEAIGPLE
jgi:histidine ammonia-lyase